jgi:hypothetical protein
MNENELNINGTIQAPTKHDFVPKDAQWLSGEGAGSWFYFQQLKDEFAITRYSPNGNTECSGIFTTEDNFKFNQDFKVTFLSHCAEVNIIQNGKNIKLSLK